MESLVAQFWPELEKERRKRSQELPLLTQDRKLFWFILIGSTEKQCDAIAELLRRDIAFTGSEFDAPVSYTHLTLPTRVAV